jgi:hypothetical protein
MYDTTCVSRDSLKVPYITPPKATGGSRGSPPGILDLLQCMILLVTCVSRDSSNITPPKATGGSSLPLGFSIYYNDWYYCISRDSLKVPYITLPKATGGSRGPPPGILDLLQCVENVAVQVRF